MVRNAQNSPASAPKPRYCVTNWGEYSRALIARGSITLWIDEEVIAGWRATGGKELRYSDVAMRAALSLRAVFRLPLRQTQGFLLSLKQMLGLTIDIPHYSSFCRRARSLDVRQPARPAGDGPLHLASDDRAAVLRRHATRLGTQKARIGVASLDRRAALDDWYHRVFESESRLYAQAAGPDAL